MCWFSQWSTYIVRNSTLLTIFFVGPPRKNKKKLLIQGDQKICLVPLRLEVISTTQEETQLWNARGFKYHVPGDRGLHERDVEGREVEEEGFDLVWTSSRYLGSKIRKQYLSFVRTSSMYIRARLLKGLGAIWPIFWGPEWLGNLGFGIFPVEGVGKWVVFFFLAFCFRYQNFES